MYVYAHTINYIEIINFYMEQIRIFYKLNFKKLKYMYARRDVRV